MNLTPIGETRWGFSYIDKFFNTRIMRLVNLTKEVSMIKSTLQTLYDASAVVLLEEWLQDILKSKIYDENGVIQNVWFCYTPRYNHYYEQIGRIIKILPFFNYQINDRTEKAIIRLKEPSYVKSYGDFLGEIDYIKNLFNLIQKHLSVKMKLMKSFEFFRMDEALRCYFTECYNATVGMAVTAIENRLLAMLKKNTKCKSKKIDNKTLGGLINEYLTNKENYNNCVPDKHEQLLELCNTYRIFSVHPKKENISLRIANSILNLTFEFLLDKKMAI